MPNEVEFHANHTEEIFFFPVVMTAKSAKRRSLFATKKIELKTYMYNFRNKYTEETMFYDKVFIPLKKI